MFKIVQHPKVWWPVKVRGVTEEGEEVENEFKMRFVILDEDDNLALQAEISQQQIEGSKNDKLEFSTLSAAIILRLAEDWRDVSMEDVDTSGVASVKSLPFTPENVTMMMKQPGVFWAITQAYAACRYGAPKDRAGN